jgi:hypothetical protein
VIWAFRHALGPALFHALSHTLSHAFRTAFFPDVFCQHMGFLLLCDFPEKT